MTGFIEDMLLRDEGQDDQDIANINADLPDIQHLDQVLIAEWPRIAKIAPHLLRAFNHLIAKQRSLT